MPLYDYKCPSCGHKEKDYFVRPTLPAPERITCSACGDGCRRQLSAPARTPARWGDSAAYFDRGLGMVVENESQRQRVMAERGLREVSDVEIDEMLHTQASKPSQVTA